MKTYCLRRNRGSELSFEGEQLAFVDDREWLGVTANWWELTLYRTTAGTFVLGSVYYQNCPRGLTVYDAQELDTLGDVHACLRRCGAPDMITDALLLRARRAIKHRDVPAAPMRWRDEEAQATLPHPKTRQELWRALHA